MLSSCNRAIASKRGSSMQQPTPPVWMTGLSTASGVMAAERGHVIATLLSGSIAGPMFEAYRERARELGWEAGPDRFAYAACIGVGETREEGLRRADQVADYARTAGVVAEQYTNPPSYNSTMANVAMLKGAKKTIVMDENGEPVDAGSATVEQFMESTNASAVAQAEAAFVNQADAPACPNCGSITIRAGSCYSCPNCGSTSGCG